MAVGLTVSKIRLVEVRGRRGQITMK